MSTNEELAELLSWLDHCEPVLRGRDLDEIGELAKTAGGFDPLVVAQWKTQARFKKAG